jgi:hypothetical protein
MSSSQVAAADHELVLPLKTRALRLPRMQILSEQWMIFALNVEGVTGSRSVSWGWGRARPLDCGLGSQSRRSRRTRSELGEEGRRFAVVASGGGGDRPHAGGQTRGPIRPAPLRSSYGRVTRDPQHVPPRCLTAIRNRRPRRGLWSSIRMTQRPPPSLIPRKTAAADSVGRPSPRPHVFQASQVRRGAWRGGFDGIEESNAAVAIVGDT